MISRQSTKSFTLIELLIAIFILAVGIVGILYMFPMGTRIGKSAQMASVATQLGQAKMEEIIFKSYNDISSSTEAYGEISDFEAYKRVTTASCFDPNGSDLTPNCPDTGIKKIEVNVSWKSPFGVTEKSINLTSLIAKR